jgi:hypothetical protein
MRLGRRYRLSAGQKTEIWRRWKAGESLHEIGRALGKDHGSIHFLLSQHGGIIPAVRRRSERTLTLAEREEISRGIASESSIREIARNLQRAASTVSREMARHGGRPRYRASKAGSPRKLHHSCEVRHVEPAAELAHPFLRQRGKNPLPILCHFHGLLFARQCWINRYAATHCNVPHSPRDAHRYSSFVNECIGDFALTDKRMGRRHNSRSCR